MKKLSPEDLEYLSDSQLSDCYELRVDCTGIDRLYLLTKFGIGIDYMSDMNRIVLFSDKHDIQLSHQKSQVDRIAKEILILVSQEE